MNGGQRTPAAAGVRRRGRSTAAAVALLVVLPTLFASAPPASAGARVAWEDVLNRARSASRGTAHHGEMLIATFGEGEHTQLVDVSASGRAMTMTMPDERTVRLSPRGGELTDPAEGYTLPLPPVSARAAAPQLLVAKYDVDVAAHEDLLGRPCTRLDVRTRAGALRERIWVDDAAGLVLRRETFDGDDRLLRLAVYLRLQMEPPLTEGPRRAGLLSEQPSRVQADAWASADGPEEGSDGMHERHQGVTAITADGVAALEAAGWDVPDGLPAGYEADGAFVVAGETASPLQLVYSDGLYTVSLFQQAGDPDPASLPAGGELVDDAAGRAWTWTGAVPSRRVWEASGSTWTLVTDAPPEDVEAIVDALPQHRRDGVGGRLRSGLARLWSLVSPWS